MYIESVQSQTGQIFDNIEILLASIGDGEFSHLKGGFPTWKHFYHCIHSLDKNFIDPGSYAEPDFHEKNMDVIYLDTDVTLSRAEIEAYYLQVKAKTTEYLGSLTDEKLTETTQFNDREYTRLELILAQLRHVFYHVGYLHCCEKIEKGETPEYVGLYKRIPDK
jgi:hypothetical protein